ncbi:unnamed protein product [Anisakis simplex]|uniref:Aftiphilin n=1 Tax=Anisakis simplex TaxID=6269 RepID=A0A0M3K3N0_ANISI|nr:unnamed protein product [Anisakis simplex]
MFEDGPPPLPVVTHSSPSHHEFSPDGGLADLADDNRLTAVADDDLDGTSHGTALAQPNSSIPDFEPECCFILPSPILVPKLDVDTNHVENQTGHVSAPSSGVETEKSSSKQEEGNTRQFSPESSQNRSKSDRKPSGDGESSHDCPVEMTSDEKICNDETQRNLTVDSTRDISENNSEPLGERKRPTRNANEISEEIRNHDQNDCFNSNGEEFHQEDANGKPEASVLNKFATSSFECSGKADNVHDSDSTGQTESRESTKTEFKACAVDGDHMPSAQCVEACNFSETVTDTEQVTMHSADENDKKDPESSECVQIQQTPSLSNASKVEHIKSSITVESKKPSDQLPENNASEVEICEDKQEDSRRDVAGENCNIADKNDEDEDDDFGDFEEFGDFAATQQPVQASLPSLCNIYKADRVKEWVVDNVQWQDVKGNEIEEDATSENDCCKNEFENVLEDLQETRHAVDSLKYV